MERVEGLLLKLFSFKINECISYCFFYCRNLAHKKIGMGCRRGNQWAKRTESRFKYKKLRYAWKKTWTIFKVKIQKPYVLYRGWRKLLLLLSHWKENFLLAIELLNWVLLLYLEHLFPPSSLGLRNPFWPQRRNWGKKQKDEKKIAYFRKD